MNLVCVRLFSFFFKYNCFHFVTEEGNQNIKPQYIRYTVRLIVSIMAAHCKGEEHYKELRQEL